jgi:hypothetical protein
MATRNIDELKNLQAVKKAEYSPQKNYTWGAEQMFGVTGLEIDKVFKALVMQTKDVSDYDKFLWLQEGLTIMNNILKEAYEQGVIQEVIPKQEGVKVEPSKMAVVAEEDKKESE